MGTRSLLAYDTGRGNYYVQYMQFDGYPSIKGSEYYNAILRGLEALGTAAINKTNKRPSQRFFSMIRRFLDNYQYESGHSVGHSFTESPHDFWSNMRNCGEEWKYVWLSNGDFVFFNVYEGDEAITYVIPWEFTRTFIHAHQISRKIQARCLDSASVLEKAWESFEAYDDEDRKLPPKILTIESGKVYAFPEQGKHGWREYSILRQDGKTIAEGMFADRFGEKKDIVEHRTFYFPFRGVKKIMDQFGLSTFEQAHDFVWNPENAPTMIGISPELDSFLEKELKVA